MVAGGGAFGKEHLTTLAAMGGVALAVAETRADELARLAAMFALADRDADGFALLERFAPDGVVVATPAAVHAPLAARALERGIPVLVDGSQSAVHMPIDVRDLDCDFFVFTGHKVYGPSGIGVLYGKRERLEAMRPFMGGGEMIEEVTEELVTYNEPPHRFEAGTPPIVQAIGLGAALEYMEGIGRDRIAAHEADLKDYAHDRLSRINSLRIFGDAPGKGAIISFELQGIHAHDVSMVIDRQGVAVRAGTHCAQPLLKRFGVTSTCRASFGMYNTRAEVDALAEALEKARKFFG